MSCFATRVLLWGVLTLVGWPSYQTKYLLVDLEDTDGPAEPEFSDEGEICYGTFHGFCPPGEKCSKQECKPGLECDSRLPPGIEPLIDGYRGICVKVKPESALAICCKDNGVPRGCMEFCRRMRGRSSEPPFVHCLQHKQTILDCLKHDTVYPAVQNATKPPEKDAIARELQPCSCKPVGSSVGSRCRDCNKPSYYCIRCYYRWMGPMAAAVARRGLIANPDIPACKSSRDCDVGHVCDAGSCFSILMCPICPYCPVCQSAANEIADNAKGHIKKG